MLPPLHCQEYNEYNGYNENMNEDFVYNDFSYDYTQDGIMQALRNLGKLYLVLASVVLIKLTSKFFTRHSLPFSHSAMHLSIH